MHVSIKEMHVWIKGSNVQVEQFHVWNQGSNVWIGSLNFDTKNAPYIQAITSLICDTIIGDNLKGLCHTQHVENIQMAKFNVPNRQRMIFFKSEFFKNKICIKQGSVGGQNLWSVLGTDDQY